MTDQPSAEAIRRAIEEIEAPQNAGSLANVVAHYWPLLKTALTGRDTSAAAAVQRERERCVRIADVMIARSGEADVWLSSAERIADAIRSGAEP